MLVSVLSFGSVWRRRFSRDLEDRTRFARTAYYNTTGVRVRGLVRSRATIAGYARFNETGGFNSNYPSRMRERVFECAPPCIWNGQMKVLFKRMLRASERPECFLVVVRPDSIGQLDLTERTWKSDDSFLISFSEWHDQQETMLLMPAYGWLRSELGVFFLEPSLHRPGAGQLRLGLVTGDKS